VVVVVVCTLHVVMGAVLWTTCAPNVGSLVM